MNSKDFLNSMKKSLFSDNTIKSIINPKDSISSEFKGRFERKSTMFNLSMKVFGHVMQNDMKTIVKEEEKKNNNNNEHKRLCNSKIKYKNNLAGKETTHYKKKKTIKLL